MRLFRTAKLSCAPKPSFEYKNHGPRILGVTSDFTNFNKVSTSSCVEDLAGSSPFAFAGK